MIQRELNGRRVILLPGHEVIRMPSAGFKTPAARRLHGRAFRAAAAAHRKIRPRGGRGTDEHLQRPGSRRVQACNERLTDPSAAADDQTEALQEVVAATSDYYAFLAGLAEDMRRFLILMGGVTGDEIDGLLSIEPGGGGGDLPARVGRARHPGDPAEKLRHADRPDHQQARPAPGIQRDHRRAPPQPDDPDGGDDRLPRAHEDRRQLPAHQL